jgi:hypothetical protein
MRESDIANVYVTQQFHPVSAAERGVLDAIIFLHEKRVLTQVIDSLSCDVRPKIEALVARENSAAPPLGFRRYSKIAGQSDEKKRQLDEALGNWARRFRLTDELNALGTVFPWVLQFGRAWCLGFPNYPQAMYVSYAVRSGPPPGLRLSIEGYPHPKERFNQWLDRIEPMLREWHSSARDQKLSGSSTLSNPDRYKWFVLMLCNNLSAEETADELNIPRLRKYSYRDSITGYALRKAVPKVCVELGVSWKALIENRL